MTRYAKFGIAIQPKLLRGLSTIKPGTLLKKQVPAHTCTPWDKQRSAFVGIDLVAHCGSSTAGHYLNSQGVTDMSTERTERIGIWGKGQMAVYEVHKHVTERLPFPSASK